MRRRRLVIATGLALALVAGSFLLFRPAPVPVDIAIIGTGPLQEIIEEEGKTRMHDHFVLAASVAGKLRRIDLHPGDRVKAGETLAWIDPSPIEPRQQAILDARLSTARANVRQAEILASRAKAEFLQTQTDLARNRELFRAGIISQDAFDRSKTLNDVARKQEQAAQSATDAANHTLEEARAALLVSASNSPRLPTAVLSPVTGRVLRLTEQSEHVIAMGAPLMEIGYSPRLEFVADFLTRDAVRIQPNMPALITDWGGDHDISGRVRLVEPGGFTKISALGAEEQRVNVLCDPDAQTDGLADGYHVNVRVIVWQRNDVLQVPSSAVFRSGGEWAAFVAKNGRAHKSVIKIGHRGDVSWEVLSGLARGDRVVIHPAAEIDDGVKIATRQR